METAKALTAYRIEDLQQQRPQQPFQCDRRTSHIRIQLRKLRRHLLKDLIHHFANGPQRMIRWNLLLRRDVAEYSFLQVVVAAHAIASFFFHSDESCLAKVAAKREF